MSALAKRNNLQPASCLLYLVGVVVGLGATACSDDAPRGVVEVRAPTPAVPKQPPLPAGAARLETPHYTIYSSATPEHTAQVAEATEGLYRAYASLLGVDAAERPEKLVLVLYRDRNEFKAHNRSRPWAEAFYLQPRSHAYYAEGPNPYHWALHEVTHQLMREVSGLPRSKWVDEGLAAYLGASRIEDGELQSGSPDPSAYPIWWLANYRLSGNITRDIASNQIIPLEQLLTDTGPEIDGLVNQYYVHYWSLTHFLLHAQGGRYAEGYKRLVRSGGTLEQFRELIGPVEQVESAWYAYLQDLIRQARAGTLARSQVAPNNSSKPTPLRGAA